MVKLLGNFSRLNPQKILVAGDLLLDTYTIGKARRISPEAPVAIIHVEKEEAKPGGAGNVILNLISMGASVVALGRIGNDWGGQTLLHALKDQPIDLRGILIDHSYKTPIKNRIIADSQQIARVDHEIVLGLSNPLEKKAIALLPQLLEGVQVVAISDYGKGFLTPSLLKALIDTARNRGIYIIADPKGIDFSRYNGVDLLKPNVGEAYTAASLPRESPLDIVGNVLFQSIEMQALMVTRSEEGISLFQKEGGRLDFPVLAKTVKDVTGAGDTVLAMMAFAIANKLSLPCSIELANAAAGIAISESGCAQITLSQLAKHLLQSDFTNKIFDMDHLHLLKAALENTPCLLISLKRDQIPDPATIAQLAQAKRTSGRATLAVIEEEPVDELILQMLASLQPLDFILLNTSKKALIDHLPFIEELQ